MNIKETKVTYNQDKDRYEFFILYSNNQCSLSYISRDWDAKYVSDCLDTLLTSIHKGGLMDVVTKS